MRATAPIPPRRRATTRRDRRRRATCGGRRHRGAHRRGRLGPPATRPPAGAPAGGTAWRQPGHGPAGAGEAGGRRTDRAAPRLGHLRHPADAPAAQHPDRVLGGTSAPAGWFPGRRTLDLGTGNRHTGGGDRPRAAAGPAGHPDHPAAHPPNGMPLASRDDRAGCPEAVPDPRGDRRLALRPPVVARVAPGAGDPAADRGRAGPARRRTCWRCRPAALASASSGSAISPTAGRSSTPAPPTAATAGTSWRSWPERGPSSGAVAPRSAGRGLGIGDQVTGGAAPLPDLQQLRRDPSTEVEGLRAAPVERAALRRFGGIRQLAAEHDPAAAPAAVPRLQRLRDRRQERPGGRGAAGRRTACSAGAISTIRPKYITAIRSLTCRTTDRSWLMKIIGQAQPPAQVGDHVDDLRLDRHVERRDRLVGE